MVTRASYPVVSAFIVLEVVFISGRSAMSHLEQESAMSVALNPNLGELVFTLLVWILPLVLVVWFIRTLTNMAASLRDIADRLVSLERAVRDGTANHAT